MAISSQAVIEVRADGSDTNGGAYVPGAGVDYSQQTAPQVAVTDAVANGTTTITSATANWNSNHQNNVVYLQGGSGSLAATRRQVMTVVNSTTITVDATVATGTGITLNLGGAMASLGGVGNFPQNLNTVWVRGDAGVQLMGNGTGNTPGNRWSPGTTNLKVRGYGTTRGDGTRAIIRASAASITLITSGNVGQWFMDLQFESGGFSNVAGIQVGNNGVALRCVASGLTAAQAYNLASGNARAIDCRATGGSHSSGAFNITGAGAICLGCTADSNVGGNGRGFAGGGHVVCCVARSNSGVGFSSAISAIGCTADRNGSHGFDAVASVLGCLSTNNTNNGLNVVTHAEGCFTYGNTGASIDAAPAFGSSPTALAGDPYLDGAGGDLRLHPGGADFATLAAGGWPQSYPGLTPANTPAAGAYQPDAGAGSGPRYSSW